MPDDIIGNATRAEMTGGYVLPTSSTTVERSIGVMACSSLEELAGKRGRSLESKHTIDKGVPHTELVRRSAGTLARRSLLLASGQVGATILSILTLWVILKLAGYSSSQVYGLMGILLAIRYARDYLRGPKPVLQAQCVRKPAFQILVDESHISAFLLAACFIFRWLADSWTIVAYVLGNYVIQLGHASFSRLAMTMLNAIRKDYPQGEAVNQALILGTGENARKVADMLLESPELETRLIGFLDYRRYGLWRYRDVPLVGHPESIEKIVANSQVDALFLAPDPQDLEKSRSIFNSAENMGVSVYVMPNLYYPRLSRIRPSYINGMPTLLYRSDPENRLTLFVKRTIDRIGALTGLILSAPIMLLTALIIKIDSKGPVFFKQVRSGLNGKPFTMYKFRTMCSDAETKKDKLLINNEMSGPVFKMKQDPRVTRLGRILRKFSVDELPQFINVICGDMSLVGPRPPLPQEVTRYEPWQRRKLAVKPGLTCLWQVNGRNEVDFEEWMHLDLKYIDNWSLWLDTKIMAKTIPAVLKGSGR